jgi:hypothetical protein
MRAVLIVSLVVLFAPAAAIAQSPTPPPASSAAPAPGAAPTKGGDITKDQYIERAVERTRRAAEKRFDEMDTNHDGVLSADERRAYRALRGAAPSR